MQATELSWSRALAIMSLCKRGWLFSRSQRDAQFPNTWHDISRLFFVSLNLSRAGARGIHFIQLSFSTLLSSTPFRRCCVDLAQCSPSCLSISPPRLIQIGWTKAIMPGSLQQPVWLVFSLSLVLLLFTLVSVLAYKLDVIFSQLLQVLSSRNGQLTVLSCVSTLLPWLYSFG